MTNIIIITILMIILGGAVFYIIKSKKAGVKCIGCPAAGNCSGKMGANNKSTCCCHTNIPNQ